MLILNLLATERQTLQQALRHHPKPYVRERAAALLKIDQGQSARQVALHGLLQPRGDDTIYQWVHRYQSQGLAGLIHIQPGRGRKAAFFPSDSPTSPPPP